MNQANDTAAALSQLKLSPVDLLFSDVPGEFAATRRVLEQVPDDHNDWRPHEKSMSLGSLATHLAQLPSFAATILNGDELDLAKKPYSEPKVSTTAERLALFDKESVAMQAALAAADWAALDKRWVMRMGDKVFINDQKGKLIRSVGLSHMAHHRAQLGVYLRLLGVPVPSVYGPTADVSFF